MSERRYYLDRGIGESRGVVTLAGRPERLLVARDGEPAAQALGARLVARVRSVERAQALAFLDVGPGPDPILNLTGEMGPITQGGWVTIEMRSQARAGKGGQARWLGPAEGPARLLTAGPSLEDRMTALADGARIEAGPAARAMADAAQDEVFETVFATPGGGSICVETTRALTAVDVDVGDRPGSTSKRTARAANLAALAEAARVLRLKGLGGLVVIDLAGRSHDAPALLAHARAAFGPDNPGVAIAPVSRFGVLELTVPRRARPVLDLLGDGAGVPSPLTRAMALIRGLEREAQADRGGRFEAIAPPAVAQAAGPALVALTARLGARLSIRADPARDAIEVVRQ